MTTIINTTIARRTLGGNERVDTQPSRPLSSGRVFVVTRHRGAIEWLQWRLGSTPVTVLAHLEAADFRPGDRVCGVLPLAWAARICAQGASAHVLTYEAPETLRGKELTAADLRHLDAQLVQYDVRVVPD